LSIFLVPILKLQHTPLPLKCYEPRRVPQLLLLPLSSFLGSRAPTPSPSTIFIFGLAVESIKELGGASIEVLFWLKISCGIYMLCNVVCVAKFLMPPRDRIISGKDGVYEMNEDPFLLVNGNYSSHLLFFV
jgi:hypothetical protein